MIQLNHITVNFTKFPNKETGLKLDTDSISKGVDDINYILFKYENDSSLIELMFLKKEVERNAPITPCVLVIMYMPYSRLDRSEDGIAPTLKFIAGFINSLNFTEVHVIEPHSDVTCAVLARSSKTDFTEHLFNHSIENGLVEFDNEKDFICFPDATAKKRYSGICNCRTIFGSKQRDFETGKIKSLELFIPGNVSDPARKKSPAFKDNDVHGKNVVIVDDLCSKGGTFIMTATELKALGAKSISLIITHCEETIKLGQIFTTDMIDSVVTTNTIIDSKYLDEFEKAHVLRIQDLV